MSPGKAGEAPVCLRSRLGAPSAVGGAWRQPPSAEAGWAHRFPVAAAPGLPVLPPFPLRLAPQSPRSDFSFVHDLTSSSYLGPLMGRVWPQSQQSFEGPAQLTCVHRASQKEPCWARWGACGRRALQG